MNTTRIVIEADTRGRMSISALDADGLVRRYMDLSDADSPDTSGGARSHRDAPADGSASLLGPGTGAVAASDEWALAQLALADASHALGVAADRADVADRRRLWAAYRAGFETSAEGRNGECPEDPPARDRARVALRADFDAWFADDGESGGAS